MLVIDIPESENYDSVSEEFIIYPHQKLKLEHSLIAISKWESKWMKPFLGNYSKTNGEIFDYIRSMIIDEENVDNTVIERLSKSNVDTITSYIQSPMTATTIKQTNSKSREIITSELIYYWMVAFNIPFECQHWHLNRLLTLVNVCNIKNAPPKKSKGTDIAARNRDLNASRKKAMNTSG